MIRQLVPMYDSISPGTTTKCIVVPSRVDVNTYGHIHNIALLPGFGYAPRDDRRRCEAK